MSIIATSLSSAASIVDVSRTDSSAAVGDAATSFFNGAALLVASGNHSSLEGFVALLFEEKM